MDKIELAKEIQEARQHIDALPDRADRYGDWVKVIPVDTVIIEILEKAEQLAQAVIEEPEFIGIDYAKDYLDEVREQARQEQREKDAKICFDKANEYEIPCKDISDRHGGKLVAANTCGHAILSQDE